MSKFTSIMMATEKNSRRDTKRVRAHPPSSVEKMYIFSLKVHCFLIVDIGFIYSSSSKS